MITWLTIDHPPPPEERVLVCWKAQGTFAILILCGEQWRNVEAGHGSWIYRPPSHWARLTVPGDSPCA